MLHSPASDVPVRTPSADAIVAPVPSSQPHRPLSAATTSASEGDGAGANEGGSATASAAGSGADGAAASLPCEYAPYGCSRSFRSDADLDAHLSHAMHAQRHLQLMQRHIESAERRAEADRMRLERALTEATAAAGTAHGHAPNLQLQETAAQLRQSNERLSQRIAELESQAAQTQQTLHAQLCAATDEISLLRSQLHQQHSQSLLSSEQLQQHALLKEEVVQLRGQLHAMHMSPQSPVALHSGEELSAVQHRLQAAESDAAAARAETASTRSQLDHALAQLAAAQEQLQSLETDSDLTGDSQREGVASQPPHAGDPTAAAAAAATAPAAAATIAITTAAPATPTRSTVRQDSWSTSGAVEVASAAAISPPPSARPPLAITCSPPDSHAGPGAGAGASSPSPSPSPMPLPSPLPLHLHSPPPQGLRPHSLGHLDASALAAATAASPLRCFPRLRRNSSRRRSSRFSAKPVREEAHPPRPVGAVRAWKTAPLPACRLLPRGRHALLRGRAAPPPTHGRRAACALCVWLLCGRGRG